MTANARSADFPVEQIFLDRWSPRAYTGEAIPYETLMRLFEAARWAPSSYNSQPWRFLYATPESAHWDRFLGLLVPFNQSWAKTASVLIFAISRTTMSLPGQPAPVPAYSHSFDTGAAWMALALQGAAMGWDAHGMTGFDHDRAPAELGVPEGWRVEAAIAVGKRGDKSLLPEPMASREGPSPRNPVATFAFEGGFPG